MFRRLSVAAAPLLWLAVYAPGALAAGSPTPAPSPATAPGASGSGSVVFVLIGLALVALLVFYRRRVMEPFTRRYERPPPEDHPDEEEDRPTP